MDETTTTRYYQLADGRLREVTTLGDMDVPTPEGAVGLSLEEYQAALAVIEAEQASAEAAVQAAERAEAKATYLALVAVNLPDEVAKRLSGYTALVDVHAD